MHSRWCVVAVAAAVLSACGLASGATGATPESGDGFSGGPFLHGDAHPDGETAEAAARRAVSALGWVVSDREMEYVSFAGRRIAVDYLERKTEECAREFYYTTMSRVLHDEDRRSLGRRGALIANMVGQSALQKHLQAYLVYDMVWSGNERIAREGIDLFVAEVGDVDSHIPTEGRHGADRATVAGAVREYTYTYGIEDESEFRAWWAANRDATRSEWARRTVDRILAESAVPNERDRHVLYEITRHVALASESGVTEFRRWWELNREKPLRDAAIGLIENGIENLAAEDLAQRRRAMRQIISFIRFAETWDVIDFDVMVSAPEEPLEDREFMRQAQEAYQAWWKERRASFVVGPYHETAEGVWVTLTHPDPPPRRRVEESTP